MPKAFSQHEKELIRERLLEEGYRLFSAYGLKKTNVEELAEAAGISKGAFYNFYTSKEALFMDVVELAEVRYREGILASIEQEGSSPRARLFGILKKAFEGVKTIPLLQSITSKDYDLLSRRVSSEQLQEHMASDQAFIEELVARCRQAGIPIQVGPEEMRGLLYALVLTTLHEEDFGPFQLNGTIDVLLELVAAYCVGEVEIQAQGQGAPISRSQER
jgi:AcrR family transcriptional regulator